MREDAFSRSLISGVTQLFQNFFYVSFSTINYSRFYQPYSFFNNPKIKNKMLLCWEKPVCVSCVVAVYRKYNFSTIGHFLLFLLSNFMDGFETLRVCSPNQVTITVLLANTLDLWLPWKCCIELSHKMDLGTFFSANNTPKTTIIDKTCLVHPALTIKYRGNLTATNCCREID